jgi:predicted transcriptional regulator
MALASATYYARMADRMERNPVQGPDSNGRATVPNGRGFDKWRRFNPTGEVIWVNDIDGVPRALTRKQADVLADLLMTARGSGNTTSRAVAARLKISSSTVSRAAVRLASFGLIAYLTGRGRYGGMLVVTRVAVDDGLERFRKLAKAKIRAWAKAAEERVSRLRSNAASKTTWKEIEAHHLEHHYYSSMDAALKRPWTPEELREAGVI